MELVKQKSSDHLIYRVKKELISAFSTYYYISLTYSVLQLTSLKDFAHKWENVFIKLSIFLCSVVLLPDSSCTVAEYLK